VLAVIALSLTGLISPPPPVAGATAATAVAYYTSHRGALEVESLCDSIGLLLLVLYAATLQVRLRSMPSLAAFAAAGLVAACGLIQVAAFLTLASRASTDPAVTVLLSDYQNFLFEVSTVPAMVFLGATGAAVLTSRALPRWIGIAAIVAALLEVVAWISFFTPTGTWAAGGLPDVVSFVALLAWLAASAIATLVIELRISPSRAQPGASARSET
jgi:hypothetical protein